MRLVDSGDPIIDALPLRAKALLTQATGFYLTAKAASDWCVDHSADLTLAIAVNMGYAYELSFKAILAAKGQSDDDLKKEIGHNLETGMLAAKAAGYSSGNGICEHLRLLSPTFCNHSLRYLSFKGKVVELPNNKDMIAVLDEHMDGVARHLIM